MSITHAYAPDTLVLADVDISLDRGESLALVGPSGVGKTTLLWILGGLLRPTSGNVTLEGVAVGPDHQSNRQRARDFGWVFQSMNVLPRRTALDNVALGAISLGDQRSFANESAARLLNRVGLGSMALKPLYKLSGGETQRVCIARSLVGQPKFVLADEPTGQLDRSTSDLVLDAMWEALNRDVGLVVATHDQQVAARCDRVLRLA